MIRKAMLSDLPQIVLLSQRIHQETAKADNYRPCLENPDAALFVFEEDKSILGYILYREEGEDTEIDEIAIRQDREGQGIGKKLLIDTLDQIKTNHPGTCFLEVRKKNQRAITLYEHAGFVFYRERQNYYPDDDALCYKKEVLTHER